MPGATSVEALQCLACGHVVYTERGREKALPAVSEKKRYRPRKAKYGERRPTDTRAPWGSGPMSRSKRSERLTPVTLGPAPDTLIQADSL